MCLITGGAGCGKSYLLDALVAYCHEMHLETRKTATTGCAADNIGGVTLHNFLGMNLKGEVNIQNGTTKARNIRIADVIFIDEVSMMESEILYKLETVLRNHGNPYASFGGKSIVLLGDPAQLPPIGNHIWKQKDFGRFKVIVLRESQRQKDKVFVGILNRMRVGKLTHEDWLTLNTRMISEDDALNMDPALTLMLYPRNIDRDYYNQRVMDSMEGEWVVYK